MIMGSFIRCEKVSESGLSSGFRVTWVSHHGGHQSGSPVVFHQGHLWSLIRVVFHQGHPWSLIRATCDLSSGWSFMRMVSQGGFS